MVARQLSPARAAKPQITRLRAQAPTTGRPGVLRDPRCSAGRASANCSPGVTVGAGRHGNCGSARADVLPRREAGVSRVPGRVLRPDPRAYALDLRQFAAWCRLRHLALLPARRADIELFARDLEAAGRARATVTRGCPPSRVCTSGRSRKTCSITPRPPIFAGRGSTTNPTPLAWTATKSERSWSHGAGRIVRRVPGAPAIWEPGETLAPGFRCSGPSPPCREGLGVLRLEGRMNLPITPVTGAPRDRVQPNPARSKNPEVLALHDPAVGCAEGTDWRAAARVTGVGHRRRRGSDGPDAHPHRSKNGCHNYTDYSPLESLHW